MARNGNHTQTDLFGYLDYRRFLKDVSAELREKKQLNVRSFASQAGLKAPGYLKMVIDGKRNLTFKSTEKFCQALAISGKKKIYFEKLVLYNQTTDPNLKKNYLEELIKLLPRSSDFTLEKRHGRYFSQPYYVCIREMVVLKNFKEDFKWIARRCFPQISPAQVKEAIKVLLELGLLRRDVEGKLAQTGDFIKTEDKNAQIMEAYHFHEAMIDKARQALGLLAQNERNFYALTLPLSKELFEEVVSDFYEFRDRVVGKIAAKKKDFDEVYQINFQFFPLTKKREEESNE